MKKLSYLFIAIAILLSNIMCSVVAFNYRDMLCGIEHLGYSAPASVAFLSAIPFGIGIIICAVVAYTLYKKHDSTQRQRLHPKGWSLILCPLMNKST